MFNQCFNLFMTLSEITGKLADALKTSQQADIALESAMAKLDPLRTAAEDAHRAVNDLMTAYQIETGATPTTGNKKRVSGSKRPARSLDAILLTTTSRVAKASLKDGKKKADAIKSVMESCSKIAVKRAESISPELMGKIEQRVSEIYKK